MDKPYFEDREFENLSGENHSWTPGIYEGCRFSHCDFSQQDLSGSAFTDCIFRYCNLSMIKPENTSFNDVVFQHCKMMGIPFYRCNEFLFTVKFEDCQLTYSSFHQRKMKKTEFRHCDLREVDFTASDLRESVFDRCDMQLSIFDNCELEAADFRTAIHFRINPGLNRIRKAKFSMEGLPGLLEHLDISIE